MSPILAGCGATPRGRALGLGVGAFLGLLASGCALSAQDRCPPAASAFLRRLDPAVAASVQERPLLARAQVQGVMRILRFDRDIFERMGRDTLEMVVGIAYREDDPRSRAEMEAIRTAFQSLPAPFDWIGVRAQPLPYRTPASFRDALREEATHLLWVVWVGDSVDPVLRLAAEEGIPTLTGVPGYVARGVAVGMVEKRWWDPQGEEGGESAYRQIQVNHRASLAGGMNLNSQLLKLAELHCPGREP